MERSGSIPLHNQRWKAPEVFLDALINDEKFLLRADIYSYGQVVEYTLTGKIPWQGRNSASVELIHSNLIQKDDREEIPGEEGSDQLTIMDVIQHCRLEKPEGRPLAETLVTRYYGGKRRPL